MLLLSPLGGLIVLLAGVFIIPKTRRLIFTKTGVEMSSALVVAVALVLAIAGTGVGIMSGIDGGAGDSSQDLDATETPEPQTTHQTGDTFVVGDGPKQMEYTVTDVEQLEVREDVVLIAVHLEMENVGKESIDLTSNTFKLVDGQDREYDTARDYMYQREDTITFDQMNPGISNEGIVVFEVPKGQSERSLKIEPAGVFSNAEPHYVVLE